MNNYQKALHSSFKRIVTEAKKNPKSMALIAKFESGINELDALNIEIDALQAKQVKNNTGITADNNLLIDQYIEYLVDISGALQSYAHEKNNNALLERINYTESMLEHLSKTDILAVGSLIIDEASKLTSEELAAEGISADDFTELKKLYENVKQDNQAPQHAMIERSGYTAKIAQLINEASLLKRNILDKLATQFKRKDPEFYQKYMAAGNVTYRRFKGKNGNGEGNVVTVEKEEQKEKV